MYNRPDRQVWPWGKEVVLVKRLLVVAAMMVAMAMPALAARSAPTKQELPRGSIGAQAGRA